MYATYENVAMRAIAAAAPKRIADNEAFAASVTDRRYRRRILYTGIKQRHIVAGRQWTSDLAGVAAEAVIKKLGWGRDSIGVLIYVTQSPDLRAPSTAKLIQVKLGLSQDLMAFDVNLGCSGFTTGVQIMAGLLNQIKGRGLLLMGDCHHFAPGEEFMENSILFGAGAGAVAMEYDSEAPKIPAFQKTDGSRFWALYDTYDRGSMMDGNEIVLFSLNEVVDDIRRFHEHYGLSGHDVDFYALHQAQKIIVDGVAQNCGMVMEKVLKCYELYGNTSSASIPFALCANTEKYTKEKLNIFACGFGIGLAWSGESFEIQADGILPLIESDFVYPDLLH